MTAGFHVKSGRTVRGKRWWVVLVAPNGEVLSQSEMLNSERSARENVDAQIRAARIEAALRATDE